MHASSNINGAYRVAMICGLAPLILGVSIFLLWLITRWDWLMVAGMVTLYGGVVAFLAGVAELARFCWRAFRAPERPRKRLWLSVLGCAALLVSNFAVAGGITASVIAIDTCYTVVIHNASQQPLSGVRVIGGGCAVDFGTIPPGGVLRHSFWIQQDGELEFSAVSGTTKHSKTIAGYVTHGMGDYKTVTINPDDTISVTNNNI